MGTIICLPKLTEYQEVQIRNAAHGWNVIFGHRTEIEAEQFLEADIICGWNSAASEALNPGSKLRWVQSWSAGVDKLPLADLQHKGVYVTDASGVHPVQMTETVFAMLLAFTRNLHTAVRNQQKQRWDQSGSFGELQGRTLGVIGAGEIGVETARIGKAFGMRTVGVRRSGQPQPHIDEMFDMSGLDEVLAQSDFVVNILPLTDETRYLFGEKQFARMKRTAYFINVGRGPSVDTAALTKALESGRIAGAGLDVFDPEPLPEGHPLWSMEQVIVTPHIGGLSKHYRDRATDIFVENVRSYLEQGSPSRNLVDYSKQY